jgi:UDP-N-acetylmuramate dehydrogenase
MNIEQNVSLLPYNTFGIAARAAYFTHLTHEKDIAPLLREPIFQQQTPLILGGGSNLLFTDNFNGLVIKNELKGIEIMEETGDQVIVKAKQFFVLLYYIMLCLRAKFTFVLFLMIKMIVLLRMYIVTL